MQKKSNKLIKNAYIHNHTENVSFMNSDSIKPVSN